jgi:hypothetical protein
MFPITAPELAKIRIQMTARLKYIMLKWFDTHGGEEPNGEDGS